MTIVRLLVDLDFRASIRKIRKKKKQEEDRSIKVERFYFLLYEPEEGSVDGGA